MVSGKWEKEESVKGKGRKERRPVMCWGGGGKKIWNLELLHEKILIT